MPKTTKPLRNARRTPIQLAEKAFRELSQPGVLSTRADETRLGQLWRGLEYLDNDQSNLRQNLADALVNFGHDRDLPTLIAALKSLIEMSPEKLAAWDERERIAERAKEADALIMGLSRRARSPIERMIDKATGKEV